MLVQAQFISGGQKGLQKLGTIFEDYKLFLDVLVTLWNSILNDIVKANNEQRT
jgi:hypothetical protein